MRFIVDSEKVVGSRKPNYVVKDTATQEIKCRFENEQAAKDVAARANLALAGSEE